MANPKQLLSSVAVAILLISSMSLVLSNSGASVYEPVVVATEKDVYFDGETAHVNVSVVGPISAQFNTACQCFIVIEDSLGNVVYDARNHYYWAEIPTQLSAPPTKNFLYPWDLKDDGGHKVQIPGAYKIWGYVAGQNQMDPPRAGGFKWITVGEEMTYGLVLNAGWNLASIPLAGYGYRSDTLGLSRGDAIFSWNSTSLTYDKTYLIGVSPPNAVFPILPNEGYWIFVTVTKTLTIKGAVPATIQSVKFEVPASGGWVLFGFQGLNGSRRASDIPFMHSVPDSIPIVVTYTQTGYKAYLAFEPSTDFALDVGKAYWIWCNTGGVLTYQP